MHADRSNDINRDRQASRGFDLIRRMQETSCAMSYCQAGPLLLTLMSGT
jgi:hypothetical protein